MQQRVQLSKTDIQVTVKVLEVLASDDNNVLVENAVTQAIEIQKTLVEAIERFQEQSRRTTDRLHSIRKRAGEIMLFRSSEKGIKSNASDSDVDQLSRDAGELHQRASNLWMAIISLDIKTSHDVLPFCCQLEHLMMGGGAAMKRSDDERIGKAARDVIRTSTGLLPVVSYVTAAMDLLKTLSEFRKTRVSVDVAIERLMRFLSGLWAIEYLKEGGMSIIVTFLDKTREEIADADDAVAALGDWLKRIELRYNEITTSAGPCD